MAPGRGGRSLSLSIRNIIIKLHKAGISPVKICKTLQDKHQFKTTRQSVRRFIIRFETTGCVHDKRKPRRPEHTKVRRIHMQFINMWMAQNPVMTAANIQGRLEKQCGIQLSKEYVCMLRRKLNWTPKHMKYGQLISHKNVKHRLDWCLDQLISKDSFRDVIYVDESTVEMCSSGRLFFHRHGSNMDRLPAKAPKPKHSYKVNVWGGISHRGRTSICIFSGIMDSEIYQKILEDNLLPFATANYPDGFRLYQDNDRNISLKYRLLIRSLM
ncbi:uncharacterized protein [Magallana gigas]|uniref:uncharacterized protein n=1 Tax=Magallana gigas TaxID=29159 RepID=UPI00333EBF3D